MIFILECLKWKYGQNCELNCFCNQTNTETCDPKSGDCTCKSEWQGINCTKDVDECQIAGRCPNNSECTNTIGGFNCQCKNGFVWTNGGICEGILNYIKIITIQFFCKKKLNLKMLVLWSFPLNRTRYKLKHCQHAI